MAFSNIAIGKKIANMRKEKNITQMDMADAMGVSYQAVSNWERGNSMPDIAKLPELAVILGCSIDELLSEGEGCTLIKHVVIGDAETYVQENKVSAQIIGEVAPILKPKQTERLFNCVLERDEVHISIADLLCIAPFVGEEYLNLFVDKVDNVESIELLCGVAPFLSEEALNKLVGKVQEIGKLSQILGLAPFIKEETLDYLVLNSMEEGDISDCPGLYPFLSNSTIQKLADSLVKKGDLKAFKKIAPFL